MRHVGLSRSLTLCLVVVIGSVGTVAAARLMSVPPGVAQADAARPPAQAPARAPIIGRWDLTVQGPKAPYPSWLEVSLSGTRTLVGRFVGGGGSARPISRVDFNNGSLHFAIPPQWEKETPDLVVDATLSGDALEGTLVTPAGERHRFTGRRAPSLRRNTAPAWGDPVPLFNGKDLSGWTTFGGTSQWAPEGGILKNVKGGANLVTTSKFTDFKLHVEVNCPKGGNSGIYLRGRYEVQVEDATDPEPRSTDLGGIYGFLVPNENAGKGADSWQTFDITLVGRRVTVVLNGKTIICDQTIPGITGGALDSDEGAPGPIYLQGDHGPVQYRNLVITPAK
jgi:hypothetical protein